jgi:hypothetical protein
MAANDGLYGGPAAEVVELGEQAENPTGDIAVNNIAEPPAKKQVEWPAFLKNASRQGIAERLSSEISEILTANGLENDCCLAILEPEDSIDSFDLDRIFTALDEINSHHDKRVVLFVISAGGSIEPAYQIQQDL